MFLRYQDLVIYLLLVWSVVRAIHAHGVPAEVEIAARAQYGINNTLNLAHCINQLNSGIAGRVLQRRASLFQQQHKRAFGMDDIEEVLNTDHEEKGVNPTDGVSEIFGLRDDGCVLMPEATEGPFYTEGQYIRGEIADDEPGIPLWLNLQIIDTSTCKPVKEQYVEVWHTNATGVYSGVETESDPNNGDTTFGRGILKTTHEGDVLFRSIFPGHYAGRTSHIHVMTHHQDHATPVGGNRTLQNNIATHAGQLYFDQALIDRIREAEHYEENKQRFIKNEDDAIFRDAAEDSDPVLSYVFLEEDKDGEGVIEGGIFAWKAVGVKMTNVRELRVSETLQPQEEEEEEEE